MDGPVAQIVQGIAALPSQALTHNWIRVISRWANAFPTLPPGLAVWARARCRFVAIPWVLQLGLGLAPFLAISQAHGQTAQFVTGFPIHDDQNKEVNPYAVPIVSVVDHNADFFYTRDNLFLTVLAYTGEQGSGPCGDSGKPCGRYNQNFLPPLNGQSSLRFYVNGKYTGNGADGADRKQLVLNYRGHAGFDYANTSPLPGETQISEGTQIYAAHEGDLVIPATDEIYGTLSTYNAFYIRDASGWSTWYLHSELGSIPTKTLSACAVQPANKDRCVGHVPRGYPVARVGHIGVCDTPSSCANIWANNSCAHLHFELRAGCDFASNTLHGCKVVDPYGWEPIADNDPLGINNPSQSTSSPKPRWDLSTWGLVQPQVSGAVASISGNIWTVTISGSQFDTNADPAVTLWHKTGRYCFACTSAKPPATVQVTSKTSTQITARVTIEDTTLNLTADAAVVKVANASPGPGPRSPGIPLVLTAPTTPITSYSLILYRSLAPLPSPFGSVLLGFGGFHSATDDGHIIFNSGVDFNGDNVPDAFYDFDSSSSGLTQLTFPSFSQISSTLLNSRGDKAFLGVTQPGTAAGIYVVPAGNTSPSKVALPGDVCPSPCPVPGPSFLNVAGPFAIGESGEVVFSAQLGGSSPTPTWVLYLYSLSDGSFTKIVADGNGGDVTPLGGFFTSQNFFGSVGVVPGTGDVVFSDVITGGISTGGIFRFSRATGVLSKLVAQGDPAPFGISGTLGIPMGSLGGRSLAFHAGLNGGTSHQAIGIIPDVTIPVTRTMLVAYEGEPTGTVAGGIFGTASGNPPLPFAFFGEGLGAPVARKDGSVVFSSQLTGALNSGGSPTDQGIFLWNGRTITKIVANGDLLTNGKMATGIVQFVVNNIGNIYYFAAAEN